MSWLRGVAAALLLAIGGIGGYAWWTPRHTTPPPARALRLTIPPPSRMNLFDQSSPVILAISPDGPWVAFEAQSPSDPTKSGLYIRSVSDLEPALVRATLRTTPFFSRDSQWLGFQANGALWKVRVTGGQPERICAAADEFRGASWSDDGSIVWSEPNTGLWRAAGSSQPKLVAPRDQSGSTMTFPHVLPGGKAALVMLAPEKLIAVVSLETGRVIERLMPGASPKYVRGGFLVFRRNDAVFVAPFDHERMEVSGDGRLMTSGVQFNSGGSETSAFDVSENGDLVYVTTRSRVPAGQLVLVDRQGGTETIAREPQDYQWPIADRDGRRIAVHIANAGDRDLWLYSRDTQAWRQLTRGLATTSSIAWMPDGRSLIFAATASGSPRLFSVSVDGGEPVQLTELAEYGPIQNAYDLGPSVHGSTLMFHRQVGSNDMDLLTRPVDPLRAPAVKFLASKHREFNGRMSSDGRWAAYVLDDGTGQKIEVRSLREPDQPPHVITPNGAAPKWSPDGKTLFYVSEQVIWAVPVLPSSSTGDFTTGPAVRTLDRRDLDIDLALNQVEPFDGHRFLAVQRPRSGDRQLVYVPNWLDGAREALRKD